MSESEMRELLAAAEKVVDSCRDSDSAIARSIATVFRAILNSHAEQERKLARLESAEAVVRAAEEMALFHGSALSTSDWFDREAALCRSRTGLFPNGKDVAGYAGDRAEREAAWSEHLRLRRIELAAALDAALAKHREAK